MPRQLGLSAYLSQVSVRKANSKDSEEELRVILDQSEKSDEVSSIGRDILVNAPTCVAGWCATS
jgi:hypothetical protein